jgi:hypothetical protein
MGGDIFNATDMFLTVQGKSARTADREKGRVVTGVLQDGLENTDHATKNAIVVVPYRQQTYYTQLPEEEFIQKDVNWFRLRDITLSYNFGKWKSISNIGAFATFNDLVLISNYKGADPVSNGNTSANRGVGGFGFDYGNLPAPISGNLGIRVSF